MELNQSSVAIETANNKTTFNFHLENGLPYKNIIETDAIIGYAKDKNFFALSIYFLNKEDRLACDDFSINSYALKDNELWLTVNNNYIPVIIYKEKALEELKDNNLVFYFFDEHKKFLRGLKINA